MAWLQSFVKENISPGKIKSATPPQTQPPTERQAFTLRSWVTASGPDYFGSSSRQRMEQGLCII